MHCWEKNKINFKTKLYRFLKHMKIPLYLVPILTTSQGNVYEPKNKMSWKTSKKVVSVFELTLLSDPKNMSDEMALAEPNFF